ncbi:hypothetical protein B0H17DRAFT_1077702 [Mycena rosella]|uniref:BTB domain-containing protein n=1 Tax=Mycena rosella TaxID=1033263 RepID=A0AAD7D8I5_MYCRO|nr:hypothetical protein B0H17DRAFT_1077702 [Mycena rosella]
MEKYTEEWEPTGVKTIFKLSLHESTGTTQKPTALGAGVQYTAVCGFGWRFSFRVDQQSAPAVVVDDAGNTIDSFQVQLFFDPYLIRTAQYGVLTFATRVEHLIPVPQPAATVQYTLPSRTTADTPSLGAYVYPSNASAPSISITVTLPAALGITLPHPLEPQMEHTLEETLTGKELVDVKFYAFSRRGSERVTHPLPLFANSALLRGFSDDLDALLTGDGFSESVVVDLDQHTPQESYFEDYGYESDSDLESEGEDSAAPAAKATSSSDGETKAKAPEASPTGPDTAFTTWKALLYYLYTRRVNFRPLKSEGPHGSTVNSPTCSPKSMYRLADKLGLEDLQALALASISSRLDEHNILQEVFSSFTSVYPVIQELEVGVLTANFSEKAAEGLKEMTRKICEGEKPYCGETLFMIIRKMGAK